MKKVIALILATVLCLGLVPAASAAESEELKAANALYDLGLFKGVGTNADGSPDFDLGRAPTRYEGVTMLVRLLGKEAEAQAGTWDTPFTDVVDWAKPYVGYAYANGLTSGTSETTFSGSLPVTATQYLTFVLRALGYTSGTDFQWDRAWELSDKLGLTHGEYSADHPAITRGGVAVVSRDALYQKVNIFRTYVSVSLMSQVKPLSREELLEALPGVWYVEQKNLGELEVTIDSQSFTTVDVSYGTYRYTPHEYQAEYHDDLHYILITRKGSTYNEYYRGSDGHTAVLERTNYSNAVLCFDGYQLYSTRGVMERKDAGLKAAAEALLGDLLR